MSAWYSWLVVVGLSLTTSGLALAVSINSLHHAQEAQRKQQEQGRQVTCSVVIAQDNAFAESAPATAAGRRAAVAWHALREQLQCD